MPVYRGFSRGIGRRRMSGAPADPLLSYPLLQWTNFEFAGAGLVDFFTEPSFDGTWAGYNRSILQYLPTSLTGFAQPGILIGSHPFTTYVSGTSGDETLKVMVVQEGGYSTSSPPSWSTALRTWWQQADRRWTEAGHGDPPTFGSTESGGGFVYRNTSDEVHIYSTFQNRYQASQNDSGNHVFRKNWGTTGSGDVIGSYFDVDAVIADRDGAGVDHAPNRRYMDGYMFEIPDATWKNALGCNCIIGHAPGSIISTSPWGPGLFGWNPEDMTDNGSVPFLEFAHWWGGETFAGVPPEGTPAYQWSNATFNGCTDFGGACWIKDTRTIVVAGRHGLGNYYPGPGANCSSVGFDGGLVHQIWLIDAYELVKVARGLQEPEDVRCYATQIIDDESLFGMTLDNPDQTYNFGICADNVSATKRLLLKYNAAGNGQYYVNALDVTIP
jgi:hypothetical protein